MPAPVSRFLTNLCTDDILASKHFYTQLFAFEVQYESDWFIQLFTQNMELGLILRTSEFIPSAFQKLPQGMYLTLVVDAVDAVFENVQELGYPVVQPPHDTVYGQRRLLIKDPSGTLVDVSAPIKNFTFQDPTP